MIAQSILEGHSCFIILHVPPVWLVAITFGHFRLHLFVSSFFPHLEFLLYPKLLSDVVVESLVFNCIELINAQTEILPQQVKLLLHSVWLAENIKIHYPHDEPDNVFGDCVRWDYQLNPETEGAKVEIYFKKTVFILPKNINHTGLAIWAFNVHLLLDNLSNLLLLLLLQLGFRKLIPFRLLLRVLDWFFTRNHFKCLIAILRNLKRIVDNA